MTDDDASAENVTNKSNIHLIKSNLQPHAYAHAARRPQKCNIIKKNSLLTIIEILITLYFYMWCLSSSTFNATNGLKYEAKK